MDLFTSGFFRSFLFGFGVTAAAWAVQILPQLSL
jgi:hypothetical protein